MSYFVTGATGFIGRQLLRNHLKHCATTAIKKGPAEADRTYDELLELITSISR